MGEGDIAPEQRGRDFFAYKPYHLDTHEPRAGLARIANVVQRVLASGKYKGAIWTQGSPRIEETIYWLNLLLDTTVPVCGNAAQRPHGQVSADGAKNIVRVHRGRDTLVPEHLSKDQDIALGHGDRVEVLTPGGGGYGDAGARDPALVVRDVARGYYSAAEARALFRVALTADGAVDHAATARLRAGVPD